MNLSELKMLDTLKDLRDNHHVVGVKVEFEAEGASFEEALRLKEMSVKAGLDLTIKIGGCEAIKDMYDAKAIGVTSLVAPMIESSYAMSKYVNATKIVFSEEEIDEIKFLINIETITGFNNLEDMLVASYFSDIDGVVFGRADMTGSMGLSREDVNADVISNIAGVISRKMMNINKDMVIGGGVTGASLPVFKKLPYLSRFETRKIIFDAQKAIAESNADQGILKAINFELMWLKNKREYYGMAFKKDEVRYKKLTEQLVEFCATNVK